MEEERCPSGGDRRCERVRIRGSGDVHPGSFVHSKVREAVLPTAERVPRPGYAVKWDLICLARVGARTRKLRPNA